MTGYIRKLNSIQYFFIHHDLSDENGMKSGSVLKSNDSTSSLYVGNESLSLLRDIHWVGKHFFAVSQKESVRRLPESSVKTGNGCRCLALMREAVAEK